MFKCMFSIMHLNRFLTVKALSTRKMPSPLIPYSSKVLVSLPRSTEICISLVTEAVYWASPPGALSAAGSLLVMVCVAAMALHDTILAKIKSIGKTDSNQ